MKPYDWEADPGCSWLRHPAANAPTATQRLYDQARQLDPWPGDDYGGTSLLAACRGVPEAWAATVAPLPAVDQLRRAVKDAGWHPAYHRKVMARHRREWPTLWAAIDRLLKESEELFPGN